MFHHGYLSSNEYHFRDYYAVVSCRSATSPSLSGNATVVLTSHNLFIDFEKRDEIKEEKLLIVDLSDVSRVEADGKMVAVKCTSHHEVSSDARNEVNGELAIIFKDVDSEIAEMLSFLRGVNRIRQTDENEFGAQIEKKIVEVERNAISSALQLLENQNINVEFKTTVFLVEIYARTRGLFVLSPESVFFFPFKDGGVKFTSLDLQSIVRAVKKPWRMHTTAIELYLEDKSYFFAFQSVSDRDSLYKRVAQIPSVGHSFTLSDYTEKWNQRLIGNYEYLTALNEFGGRTFHDIAQYPVFPWVLQQYDSVKIDLTDPENYRDLSVSIKAINKKRYETIKQEEKNGTLKIHFSEPTHIIRLLRNKFPKLHVVSLDTRQNNLFTHVLKEWKDATSSLSNVNELIPEFYAGAGKILAGKGEESIVLPPWASSCQDFILQMRAALESSITDEKIHHWINSVFGAGQQLGDSNFHESSYKYTSGKLDALYPNELDANPSSPVQLFTRLLEARKSSRSNNTGLKQLEEELNIAKRDHEAEREQLRSEINSLKNSAQSPSTRVSSPNLLQARMMKLEEQLYENETKMRVIQQLSEAEATKKDELIKEMKGVISVLEKKLANTGHSEHAKRLNELEDLLIEKERIIQKQSEDIEQLQNQVTTADSKLTIDSQREEIEGLTERIVDLQCLIEDLQGKRRSHEAIKSSLRSYSPNGKFTNWESMFNELTAKYDQLYKGYKIVVEQKNTLKVKTRDLQNNLHNTEKTMEREVSSLEKKLQQTLAEKLSLYDRALELEGKCAILSQENRQYQINMHFLEQKFKNDNMVREKTVNLLSNAESKLPDSYFYANESTLSDSQDRERLQPFSRRRSNSPASPRSIDNISMSSSSPSKSRPTSPRSPTGRSSPSRSPRPTLSPRKSSPRVSAPSPSRTTPKKLSPSTPGNKSSSPQRKTPSVKIPPNQVKKGVISTPTRTITIKASTPTSPSTDKKNDNIDEFILEDVTQDLYN